MTDESLPSKRQKREKKGTGISKLNVDEWILIFEILCDEDPWFLSRLCLVSKVFKGLATPLLYRSVFLPHRLDDLRKRPGGLLCRLLADSQIQLRACVQELIVPQIAASYSNGQRDDFEDHDYLAQLVDHLPNLRRVQVMHPLPFTDRLIDSLDGHPNRPELQILAVQGWEKVPPRFLDCVSTIKASLLRETQEVPTPSNDLPSLMRNFQELFFSCRNLENLSLTMYGPFQNPETLSAFQMTGEEDFPPIKSLSLNGYYISQGEWSHWRDRFSWASLCSLAVGPQPNFTHRLLQCFNGYATSLKHFKISVWTGEDEAPDQESLERFLYSFDSLESLEIINYVCPVEALANHPNLVHLCVHLAEDWDSDEAVAWWNAVDVDYLNENCPKLEVLEIDFERKSGEWDNELLISLAKGFVCLRELSLHVRVGSVRGDVSPLEPVLNYQSAREIGSTYFEARRHFFDYFLSRVSNKEVDKLNKLTLKMGIEMHLHNRLDADRGVEDLNKKTFELRRSRYQYGEVSLAHPEREKIEVQNRQGYPGATAERIRNVIRVGELGALHENVLKDMDHPQKT